MEAVSIAAINPKPLCVSGLLLHSCFLYVKSCVAACSLPTKLDSLLAVTFISVWHLSCQERMATLSSLCLFLSLAKCRSNLSCASFAAVLVYFTGGTELQGLQDALSLQTIFSYTTSCTPLHLVWKRAKALICFCWASDWASHLAFLKFIADLDFIQITKAITFPVSRLICLAEKLLSILSFLFY